MWSGITFAIFHKSGNSLFEMLRLQSLVITFEILGTTNLTTVALMSSRPVDLECYLEGTTDGNLIGNHLG